METEVNSPDTRKKVSCTTQKKVSYDYILKIQQMIEECLVQYMDLEECVERLSSKAQVDPVITRTVWKEMAKENEDFFIAYENIMSSRHEGKLTSAGSKIKPK